MVDYLQYLDAPAINSTYLGYSLLHSELSV